jgi:collagenase-like PrtC family protease
LYGLPLEIHASTQQTVTCVDGVEFAAQYTNAARVVVGRELSLADIAAIASNTNIEIEAFVHGALCVSYSGQCFSSEAWGGRSANRGQCAQACRLPYGLIVNGKLKHLSFDGIEGIMGKTIRRENGGGGVGGDDNGEHDEIQYLLSPQDLCGLEQVEGLVRAGVSCLKVEGRLKDASYVAATTRAYRQAIDAVWDKLMKEHGGMINSSSYLSRRRILSSPDESVSRYDLTHVFARGQDEVHDGLTPGFFDGPQHQRLVRGRSPRHRGVHVGRVISSNGGAITIQLDDKYTAEDMPLKRGDGLVIDRGMPQEKELGGPVYDVLYQSGNAVTIRFGRDVERQEDAGEATARPCCGVRSEKNLRQKRYKKSFKARKASQRQLCIMYNGA